MPAKRQNGRAKADDERDNIGHRPWLEAAREQKILVVKCHERGTRKPDEKNPGGQPVEARNQSVHATIKAPLGDVRGDQNREGQGDPNLKDRIGQSKRRIERVINRLLRHRVRGRHV